MKDRKITVDNARNSILPLPERDEKKKAVKSPKKKKKEWFCAYNKQCGYFYLGCGIILIIGFMVFVKCI